MNYIRTSVLKDLLCHCLKTGDQRFNIKLTDNKDSLKLSFWQYTKPWNYLREFWFGIIYVPHVYITMQSHNFRVTCFMVWLPRICSGYEVSEIYYTPKAWFTSVILNYLTGVLFVQSCMHVRRWITFPAVGVRKLMLYKTA